MAGPELMEDNMTTAVSTEARAAKPPVQTGGALAALVPQDLDQAFRLAQALAGAGDMVPKHYQGQPHAVMAAIIRGMEVGLAPMQALASLAVINGRASLWGDALPALMQRAGHHVDVALENEGDLEKAVAVATLTRGDTGKTITRRFSYQDAKRAGLAGKTGPWQSYPLRMLSNRARAFAIRDGAADALMGLAISDDVSDYGPDKARDVTPKAAPLPGRVMYIDDPTPGRSDDVLEMSTSPEDDIRAELAARDAALEGGAA
jgi:hypothetical protein